MNALPNNFVSQLILVLCLQNLFIQSVGAFDWTSNDIQLLYGDSFRLGDNERTTVTLEHSDGWQYGTNYFFVDIADRNDIGVQIYAELYSYLSMNKLSGYNWSFGPVKDVFVSGGLNISNKPENDNFQAYLFGLGIDLYNSLFDYLQLGMFAYKADDINRKIGIQITPVWSLPFEIAEMKFKFRGFADFSTGNTNPSNNFHILAQPQLLLDIGDLIGLASDQVYVGTEYSYWHNKFGIKGINESVAQVMIIGFF